VTTLPVDPEPTVELPDREAAATSSPLGGRPTGRSDQSDATGASVVDLRPPSYRKHHMLAIVAFIAVVALVMPHLLGTRSSRHLGDLWLAYSIAGIGFYWTYAVAGRFAFCQPFMMALGGYTSAYVTGHQHQPFWFGLLAAVIVVTGVAALIGLALHRAQLFYFAMATFAVTQMGAVAFAKATGFTGPNGLVTGVSPPVVFGKKLLEDADVFWLLLGVLALVLVLAALIERSPIHREATAAREAGTVATTLGVKVGRIRLSLFVLGSATGGLAGALIAHWTGVIGTETFGLELAIGLFLVVLLGGRKSFWGPVVGAAFYLAVPDLLSGLDRYKGLVYGIVLLGTIMAFPDGLIGLVQHLGDVLRHQRFVAPLQRMRARLRPGGGHA